MAKVDYNFPVEALHGKVQKTHNVGFAKRKDTGVNFTQTYTSRSHTPSENELSARAKFSAAAKATRARLQDPKQAATDQVAFQQQHKYKTLYGFVFNLVYNSQN